MATLSLNKAEKVFPRTKKTIKNDLENGTLSGRKNARGHWEIEESELARVYGVKSTTPEEHRGKTPQAANQDTVENLIKIAELEVELKALRVQMERADTERERERENLSSHIEDLRSSMAILTDQRSGQRGVRFLGLRIMRG